MVKLTKLQIEEIKKLRLEGRTILSIARQFNVAQLTIIYWTNDETRKKIIDKSKNIWNKKTPEEKKQEFQNRKEYMRNYMRNKYQNNQEFRNKEKLRQINIKIKKLKEQNENGNLGRN